MTRALALLLGACWTGAVPPPETPPPAPTATTGGRGEATRLPQPPPAKPPVKLAVTSLEPSVGDAAGGTYVMIRGGGFIADGPRNVKVYFGPRQATVVRFASDDKLIVQAPGGTAGDIVDVTIVFDPGGTLRIPRAFRFVPSPP